MTAEPDIKTHLPQAVEAEFAVVSCLLKDPQYTGAICAEKNISEAHFVSEKHSILFKILFTAWMEGKRMDGTVLAQKLHDSGDYDDVGGYLTISDMETYPTTAIVSDYCDILQDKRLLRELYRISAQTKMESLHKKDGVQLLGSVMDSLCHLASGTVKADKPKSPKELAQAAIERAEERIEKRGLPDSIMRTGLKQLDEAMSGIRKGDFVLISGKEKSGKTSLAFNVFEHVVFEQKKRSLGISLEMKLPEITDRMIASMGRINFTNILNGWMEEGESNKFTATVQRISEGRFQIRDDVFSLPQIVAVMRQYKSQHADFELAIVDYLQLVDAEKSGKDDSREQIIAKTSRTLRRLANELDIAILMLVQLNDDGAVRESRAPGMDCTAHIRIEPGKTEQEKWARVVYQRNGPSNVGIPLTHLGQFLRFEQAAQRDEEITPETKRRQRYEH